MLRRAFGRIKFRFVVEDTALFVFPIHPPGWRTLTARLSLVCPGIHLRAINEDNSATAHFLSRGNSQVRSHALLLFAHQEARAFCSIRYSQPRAVEHLGLISGPLQGRIEEQDRNVALACVC